MPLAPFRVILTLLACTMLLAPTHARADDAAEAAVEEVDDTPENCAKEWFCFKPPADETTHASLTNSKFKTWLATATFGPLGTLLIMPDADKPVLKDDDIVAIIKAYMFPAFIIIGMYMGSTLCFICPPAGYLGYIVTTIFSYFVYLWVIPMNHIALVNRAAMRGKTPAAAPADAPAEARPAEPAPAPAETVKPAEPAPATK